MGEYAKINGNEVKLGTCENLYYTTFQQLKPYCESGEVDEIYIKGKFRFRFSFPDEKIEIGNHEDFDRGVLFKVPKSYKIEISHQMQFHRVNNKAGDLGFYLPCIQESAFPVKKFDWDETSLFTIFEITQQKPVYINGTFELQSVVRCPYCGSMAHLSEEEIQELMKFANEMPKATNDFQKQLIEIAMQGYK